MAWASQWRLTDCCICAIVQMALVPSVNSEHSACRHVFFYSVLFFMPRGLQLEQQRSIDVASVPDSAVVLQLQV